jgi:ribonucleoside-diphosphate reductase alpha chain
MDAFATSISLALQYGVPLKALIDKFSHMRFEPAVLPIIRKSLSPSRSWTTSSAGSLQIPRSGRPARVGVVEPADERTTQPLLPGLLPQGGAKSGNGHVTAIAEERFPFRLQEDAPRVRNVGRS